MSAAAKAEGRARGCRRFRREPRMPFYPITRLLRIRNQLSQIESPPTQLWGVILICVRRCPTFPPGLGSIIGAGRLSFRVRDGSGRFPAAIDRRNFFHSFLSAPSGGGEVLLVVGCECLLCIRGCVVASVCKFSAG
jgi:hypothetical protein